MLCIIKITQCKTLKYDIKKTTKISGKKHHTISNKNNYVDFESKITHVKDVNDNPKVFVENQLDEKSINNNIVKNTPIENMNSSNSKIDSNHKEDADNNYYMLGGGVVSIALVGIGFFNLYQRKRNTIFSLTKEELEELDKTHKINNSYTSLSEEEKRFLHKINARKNNNTKHYDELSEEEILSIRRKNGWVGSDDEDFQLRRRKTDKRLSSNVKIINTNTVAPRHASLNIKPSNNSLSNYSYRKSYDAVEELKRENTSIYAKNSKESLNISSKGSNKISNKKNLSIITKNISMPPIKMICTIVKNYNPVRPDEIKLHLGDKVEIVNVYKDGWATGKVISNDESSNHNNNIGYFPLAHASEPEIIDDSINNFMMPSPLTPPINRSIRNLPYQNSPLSATSPFNNIITNTSVATSNIKSKNRHTSMVAISSSSILKQEPQSLSSLNNSNSSVISINNNINIVQHHINNGSDNEINNRTNNLNININVNQNFINNNISINNNKENENTPSISSNTVFFSAPTTPTSSLVKRTSLMDPQTISSLLSKTLKEEKMINEIQLKDDKEEEKACHSQKVFDFLRNNVYSSSSTMEEREYYKKCLERLRMSKSLDAEINKN